MMKLSVFVSLVATANAFSPIGRLGFTSTRLHESFGFRFAEDTYENQPDFLKGEQEYKQFVNKYQENNMLNRKYNVVGRVRELDLLGATAEAGILSKLEANGVDLAKLEKLLPAIEELGLLEFVGSNQQFLINLVAPLLIEPAPLLLPGVAALLAAGPSAFFALAFATGGLEIALLASNAEVPLVGLPAGPLAGLLLVPLTVILGAAGAFLANAKKA